MTVLTQLLAGVFVTGLVLGVATAEEAATDNAHCFRCHAWEALADRDQGTGRLRDLHVAPALYQNSDHGRLNCRACHKEGYDTWSHESEGKAPADCLQCHRDEGSLKFRMPAIEQQVAKDVHARVDGGMGCFSCHDPHRFNAAALGRLDTGARVALSNGICFQCHASAPGSELVRHHAWLPGSDRHWQAVRCVECHTPEEGRVSHGIEPAKRAERRCEACHSQDSMLLAKLYRHRALEERERGGFVNSVVLNDAYVIGMTRNRLLDWASLALVAGTVVTLAGHGLGRWWAGRKRKGGGS